MVRAVGTLHMRRYRRPRPPHLSGAVLLGCASSLATQIARRAMFDVASPIFRCRWGCDGPTRDEREYSGTVMGTAAAVKRSLGLLAEAVNG